MLPENTNVQLDIFQKQGMPMWGGGENELLGLFLEMLESAMYERHRKVISYLHLLMVLRRQVCASLDLLVITAVVCSGVFQTLMDNTLHAV